MLRALAAAAAPALTRRAAMASAAPAASASLATKATTGIVGLDVDPAARASLEAALGDVRAAVAAHVPATAEYRRSLEALCEERYE